MKPLVLTNDSLPGRTLLAIRAPGGMTTEQLNERFSLNVAPQLVAHGLATFDGEIFRITEAGRAACPLRNPLAGPGLPKPAPAKIEETDMSKVNAIHRPDVLKAIQQAGPAGIQRATLIQKFGGPVAESAIANHLVHLKKAGEICTPSRGLLVATHPSPAPASAPADQPQVSETTAAAGQAESLSLQGPAESEEVPAPAAESPAPARGDSLTFIPNWVAVTDVVELETTDGLEIAIYNTGRLVMESEDGTVEMSREVVLELRRYLGLFLAEEASI